MAFLETKHVALRGMSACVPKNIEKNIDTYQKWGDYTKVRNLIGIDHVMFLMMEDVLPTYFMVQPRS